MTNKEEDLKKHYLETHINLLSHILFGINYTFNADENKYECQIQSNHLESININDKLKKINAISEKINQKEFKSNNTFKEKIKKLNENITKDKNKLKDLFTTIMT